ncbi:MAG: DUF4340 domain-containing protein [Synergistaceae bacterium]|jgi:hypothetical protein|nr:DUF4340 domain-containing protein [Synergistaceae bacterium]
MFKLGKGETIDSISIENMRGTFLFFKENARWVVEENGTRYRAGETKMRILTQSLATLDVTRVMKGERAEYGLSSPDAVVSFVVTGGKRYSFSVGNMTPDFMSAYARDANGGKVALIRSAVADHLTGSLTAYRDREIFSVELRRLVGIARYGSGELICEFAKTGDEGWRVKFPFDAPARIVEMSEFISGMKNWRIASFPDAANARYGLEMPDEVIVLSDDEGGVQTIEIGRREGIYQYVRFGEYGDIVALYAEDVDLSKLDPGGMMFMAPLRAALADVRSIKIESIEGVYELTYDKASRSAEFLGARITEDDFINIFYKFITVTASGFDDSSTARGESVASLDIETADGGKSSLVLNERGADSYFMRINGRDTPFYTEGRRLEELMGRIERLTGRIK